MGDVHVPATPSAPPPPSSLPKSNMPMLYYGLVVVGTAAIILAVYNLIIIKWCSDLRRRSRQAATIPTPDRPAAARIFGESPSFLLVASSFKYKKESKDSEDYECPVCLSVFEDGEEVRRLPSCGHAFHAPCIDMWLYSHFDCPVCRSPVDPPVLRRHTVADRSENSPDALLLTGISLS